MAREIRLAQGAVVLRPYRPADASWVYEAVRESLLELCQWMPWCHPAYSLEDSRAWVEARAAAWERGTEYDFAVTDAGNGWYLGSCGLSQISRTDRFGNLGYWVRRSRRGEGVATTAARLVARFGLTELGLGRVEIVVATGNMPSRRVAEKVGAVEEGTLRNRLVVGDRVYDAVMFSLVRQDLAQGEAAGPPDG